MKKEIKLLSSALILVATSVAFTSAVQAEGTVVNTSGSGLNSVSTCVTSTDIDSFMLEHVVGPTAILSSFIPSMPDGVMEQVMSGTKEIHARVEYNKATRILQNDLFLTDVGATLPSSSEIDFQNIHFAWITVRVQNVRSSCNPVPAVLITGEIANGYDIYFNPKDSLYSYSFAYTADENASTQFYNIISTSAGMAMDYFIDKAPGSLTFVNTSSESNVGSLYSNLDIFMPSLNYKSELGIINIHANFIYEGQNASGKHIWSLKDYGNN